MKLTAYDLGKRPGQNIDQKNGRYTVADRQWRQDIARQAVRKVGMQSTLAEHLGVFPEYVSRWIHGTRPVPDAYVPRLIDVIEGVVEERREAS